MSTTQLRKQVAKQVAELPANRLASAADYLRYLADQSWLKRTIEQSEREAAAGKGVNWRTVRRDV